MMQLAQLTILNVPPAQQTPMVRTSTRSSTGGGGRMSDEGPYREEDVLIALQVRLTSFVGVWVLTSWGLQLLAYLSKYPHVRQAFYKKRGDVGTAASTSKYGRFIIGFWCVADAGVQDDRTAANGSWTCTSSRILAEWLCTFSRWCYPSDSCTYTCCVNGPSGTSQRHPQRCATVPSPFYEPSTQHLLARRALHVPPQCNRGVAPAPTRVPSARNPILGWCDHA